MGNRARMNVAALVSVFTVAFIYFWGSIPLGIAQGLPPVAVVLTASLSYAVGVAITILAGQPIRDWIMRRFGSRVATDPNSRIRRIWDRYGLVGLALIAPVTTGAPIGAIIAISLNAPPRRLFLMMSLGGLMWGMIVAVLVSLGVAVVQGEP